MEWISIEDKKDLKDWDDVLLSDGNCCESGYYFDGNFHFDNEQATIDDDNTITHWMLRPNPPKNK